jgi:hypothetical protein
MDLLNRSPDTLPYQLNKLILSFFPTFGKGSIEEIEHSFEKKDGKSSCIIISTNLLQIATASCLSLAMTFLLFVARITPKP